MEIKANQLREAYDKNNCFEFFKLFPSTFNEFLELYGFDDEKGEMLLYQVYEKHINFFFASYESNKEYFIPKIFNLAKDGYWDADATDALQNNIAEFTILHSEEIVDYLNTKSAQEIANFWHFVFDGSRRYDLQNKEKFETLYFKINSLDKDQGKLLKEGYKRMSK